MFLLRLHSSMSKTNYAVEKKMTHKFCSLVSENVEFFSKYIRERAKEKGGKKITLN